MQLDTCADVPERIASNIFNPFVTIATPELSVVHENFESLRSSCSYYSVHHASHIDGEITSYKMNILHINARSIGSDDSFEEFELFIHRTKCMWHIICVSETWLSDHMIESR